MSADTAHRSPTPVAGREALVVGLGNFGGGLGTARWLVEAGARVTVTDLRGAKDLAGSVAALASLDVRLVLGRHDRADFERADLVVANPAVPPDAPLLGVAREHGATVTSALALALERLRGPLLAVTGTQGKSSTAHILYQLLRGAGHRAHFGGNIGGSLLEALDTIRPDDVVVLELSSYQLEALPPPSGSAGPAAVVGVTNVLADHLERHGDEAHYFAAKARILELLAPSGIAVLPSEDARFDALAPAGRVVRHGVGDAAGDGLAQSGGRFRAGDTVLGRVADLRVRGRFQRANALVALGMAHAFGVAPETLRVTLPSVTGLPHRMQDLGIRGDLHVIDNGVSTTPDSTAAVLVDVPAGSSLLVGGQAKRLALDGLAALAARRATRVFAFGAAHATLRAEFARAGVDASEHETLDEAVLAALDATPAGGTLLFSPACASFDAYRNFQERALAFRALLPAATHAHPTERVESPA